MSDRLVPVSDLVTLDEIAERLDWSFNATLKIVTGKDGRYHLKFPRPLVGRAARGVWLWTDVEAWLEVTAEQVEENQRRAAHLAATTNRRASWRAGRRTA